MSDLFLPLPHLQTALGASRGIKHCLTGAGAEWKLSHPAAGHHQRDAVGITVTTAKALDWKRCVTAGKHKHQSDKHHSPQGNVFIFQIASITQRKIIERVCCVCLHLHSAVLKKGNHQVHGVV